MDLQERREGVVTDAMERNLSKWDLCHRIAELEEAAEAIDGSLLRNFDAGMLDQATEQGCCGIDIWGTLKDFRATFGLDETMSDAGAVARGGVRWVKITLLRPYGTILSCPTRPIKSLAGQSSSRCLPNGKSDSLR